MFFRKSRPPTRSELVAAADRARSRGRLKKAVSGYRKALELEPDDPTIHGKLAPLLARTGEPEAALRSFHASAEGHLGRGFADRAIAVYIQMAETFPLDANHWRKVAQMQLARERQADAAGTLLLGRMYFRRRGHRTEAIALLNEALALQPGLFLPKLDLARLLAKEGQEEKAMALLEPLAKTLKGPPLRAIRWTQLRIKPRPGAGWRWLRAALMGR